VSSSYEQFAYEVSDSECSAENYGDNDQ